MDFPLNPGEKYALIAVNGSTDITEIIDLGDGLFALPGGGFKLPDHWRAGNFARNTSLARGSHCLCHGGRQSPRRTSCQSRRLITSNAPPLPVPLSIRIFECLNRFELAYVLFGKLMESCAVN